MTHSFLKQRKVLVLSARGMGNVGDDLVSQVTEELLSEAHSRVEITHGDIPCSLEQIRNAELVVLGGGGLLYDSNEANIENYCEPLIHAQLMGKKTAMLGVGTQKITTTAGRLRYKEVLDRVDLICVRDKEDVRVLKEDCGVTTPVLLTADLAFLLPRYTPPSASSSLAKELIARMKSFSGDKELIAVNIVNRAVSVADGPYTYSSDNGKSVDILLDELLDTERAIVFLVHSEDDRAYYDSFIANHTNAIVLDLPHGAATLDLMHIYREVDVVLTSRYHALICAALTRRPVIMLSGKSLKIDRLVSSAMPSLRSSMYHYKDIENQQVRQDLISNLSNTSVIDEGEVNSLIICAEKNLKYSFSLLQGLNG